ncbi:LysR family transcriptional regulator ArgP [Pseudomonas sp. Marseille-Q5115]|uniref:LysR family transcriptional regulator ArgP n=1 Tax=Pseudomonas sp. Marseille-Q5115 TaxID=2866593 RepID=UPI001CE47F88|nr:LysR family transcriptional regulator ArgP [Pseudomonas sp. Marseille-Q5115]
MFDYKLLVALATVIEQGGFERAAQALGLSQSAVSQRVKLLEARLGQPVLVRESPPNPTPVGRQLLNHVQQVRLLERDLQEVVPSLDESRAPERLRVAINADSLATWWPAAVASFCQQRQVLLDLVVEDQDVGLRRMRAGDVAACLCGEPRPVAGARSEPLGAMRYRAVASQAFIDRHFPTGFTTAALARVPALVFGPDDLLQHRFMASLGLGGGFAHHLVPSSEGFVRMAEAGLGWGLVPEQQVREQLAKGSLHQLLPGHVSDVPLYWHHWRSGGKLLSDLGAELVKQAARALVPLSNVRNGIGDK